MQQSTISKNVHLLLSTVIVIPVALVYGVYPKTILQQFLNFKVESTDLSNVFRAIMGLYLAFACLWILGIVKSEYWKTATISNMLFMGGLASGRILSLFFDGSPSTIFLVGTTGELVLSIYGLFALKHYRE